MSAHAIAWSLDQRLPGTPKLVLIALANFANHKTGRVDFDSETIANFASIRESGLYRYLGALERNGYVRKDVRKTPQGEERDYWLALDRDPALAWHWSAQDDEGEATAGGPAPESVPSGTSSPAFDRTKQDDERKASQAAHDDPARPVGMVGVIEGSKAFRAWCGHLRAQNKVVPYVRGIRVNGEATRGFWMPTLFPPGAEESAA